MPSFGEIIKFKKIIGQNNEPSNYIKELSNGIFVSGGDNKLFFYNNISFKIINTFSIKNINVYEKKNIIILIKIKLIY